MRAIILAAGAGRRLGLAGPKSLVEVGGMSILERQVSAFAAAGVDDFVLVVGFEQDKIRRHVESLATTAAFTFIVNERFADTNTIYSLYLAREHLATGAFYANADVLFDRRLPQRLLSSGAENALAVQTGRCAEEEVKVIVRDNRVVQIGKRLDPAECFGEFVGVARFGEVFAPKLAEALAHLVEREQIVSDYFELALDRLCPAESLTPVDITDLPCREIDFPDDLGIARQDIVPRLVP
jgi:choline kinase